MLVYGSLPIIISYKCTQPQQLMFLIYYFPSVSRLQRRKLASMYKMTYKNKYIPVSLRIKTHLSSKIKIITIPSLMKKQVYAGLVCVGL